MNNPHALLLDRRQAADALAISVASLDRMVRRGEIPSIRLGRSVRFPVAALRDWIKQKQAPPGATDGASR